MKTSFNFIWALILMSVIFLANCKGKDCASCCNETDAMYGEDREVETAPNTNSKESGNTGIHRNAGTSSQKSGNTTQPGSNVQGRPSNGDPENSGNGNGDNSSGLNSSGQNIGNKSSSQTNPSTGATGSASPSRTRGNSGEGRPY